MLSCQCVKKHDSSVPQDHFFVSLRNWRTMEHCQRLNQVINQIMAAKWLNVYMYEGSGVYKRVGGVDTLFLEMERERAEEGAVVALKHVGGFSWTGSCTLGELGFFLAERGVAICGEVRVAVPNGVAVFVGTMKGRAVHLPDVRLPMLS